MPKVEDMAHLPRFACLGQRLGKSLAKQLEFVVGKVAWTWNIDMDGNRSNMVKLEC